MPPSWRTAPVTASNLPQRRGHLGLRALVAALGLASAVPTLAQSGPGIYTCVTADGRRITADRPIVQCLDREQQELRNDGTVKRVIKPPPTAEERAKAEALEKARAEERIRVEEAARRDKTLMQRYPNEAAHKTARGKELAHANELIAAARKRVVDLESERKALLAEAEFFRKGNVPVPLKRKLDENDINMGGAVRTIAAQQSEITKINERFDAELSRLKRLWAGEPPGFGVAATPGSAPSR